MSLPGEIEVSFSFCSRAEEREPLLSKARSFEQPRDNTAANLLDRELIPIAREYTKNACTADYNQEQINLKKDTGFDKFLWFFTRHIDKKDTKRFPFAILPTLISVVL